MTFLDCGMVGELSIAQRAHLVMFLWTFVKGDVAAMGQQLRSLSVPFRPIDENRFLKDFERRMSRYQQGSKPDVKLVMSEATGILRDNGLRLDPQLTLGLKAMVQSSAFFTRLAPANRTFTDVALEDIRDLAADTFTEDVVIAAGKKEATKIAGRAIQEAPEYLKGLVSWRDQVKKGKFTLYLDTTSLNQQVDTLRSIAAMLVVALLVAGGMIGGAIAANVFGSQGSEQAATYAQWVFFASVGVGVVLVLVFLVRMVRDLRGRRRE